VLLLGHRGARKYAPENTLAAFELALEHGCDGFEFDVRATADGRAVVVHDARIRGRAVERRTFAELCACAPHLPTLDAVLAQFAARAFLYIELKVAGVEDAVLTALRAHRPPRYVVASFLPEVLEDLSRRDAQAPLGFISDDRRRLARWRELPIAVVMPQCRLATATLVNEAHEVGKQVFVWTANSVREMEDAAALGVDAVLSDDTRLLCRTLQRGG
jgi:glycerophosphoryl diester phosphodiesterase